MYLHQALLLAARITRLGFDGGSELELASSRDGWSTAEEKVGPREQLVVTGRGFLAESSGAELLDRGRLGKASRPMVAWQGF